MTHAPLRASSLLAATVAVALLAGCSAKQSPPALHDEPGLLKAGAGQAIIGLPVGIPTAGYAQSPYIGGSKPPDEPGSPYADIFPATRGLQSAPAAKVIVLDNSHSRVIIAKIDAVGITDVLTERVIQLAKESIAGNDGDIGGKLILNGTHTHDAGCRFSRASIHPDLVMQFTPEDPRSNALAHGFDTYSQEATDNVAKAVVEALKNALAVMKPATFGYGSATNVTASHDRRCENNHLIDPIKDYGGYGKDYRDPRVVVMRFDDAATGDPIAVLFNYAMHGTIYDTGNRNLSVDAPGTAEYKVEETFQKPVVAMFIQGNAADVGPSYGDNDGSQAMQHAGWELAQTVKSVYDTITDKVGTLPLQVTERWVPIGYSLLGYQKGEFFPDGAILCFQIAGNYACETGGGTHPEADIINQDDNICFTKTLPGEGKYSTRFAAARIGDLGLSAIPGEPATKVGELIMKQMKTVPGIKDVAIVGYAQDHNGYILMDDDWLSGGYNPTISFWGWKFGAYTVQQGADTFQELVTGKADHHNAPPKLPNLKPDAYTPIVPSDSMTPPSIDQDAMAQVERIDTVDVSFFGGDPGLGHPSITLQVQGGDGSFTDVKRNGWIPINNLRGYDFALFYTSSPTFKASPTATSRLHHWEVKYEPPVDLPAGTYRLHISGRAKQAGSAAQYDLNSIGFKVVPSTKLSVEGQLALADGKIVFDGTLRYPQRAAGFHPSASNADWQIDNFRLIVPRYGHKFSPAVPAAQIPAGSLTPDTSAALPATVTYVAERIVPDDASQYAPGKGPGLHAEVAAVPGTTKYTFDLPVITDEFGNTSTATSIATQ